MLSRVEMIKLLWLSVEEGIEGLREVGVLKSKSFVRFRQLPEYCVLSIGKKNIKFPMAVKNVLVKEWKPH